MRRQRTLEGHKREAADPGEVRSKQHNIFPIPIPDNSAIARTVATLNKLFDPKSTENGKPMIAQQNASKTITNNINQPIMESLEKIHIINMISELGELIADCDTNPEAGFVRGLFKDSFDLEILALPPPKPKQHHHSDWT